MNIENALSVLGFDDISELTSKAELKQHYRLYALMYHPDKNASSDACAHFLEVKEAYDLLQTYLRDIESQVKEEDGYEIEKTYQRILKEYLGIQITDNKINEVLDNILSVCEKQSIFILEKIEGNKFKLMYSILKKYRHIFFLSDEFYQEMERINENKQQKQDIIELHPTINDLLQNMIYKLHYQDEIYLVPLWHHELVYEDKISGKEFIVRCIPSLESNYWIDEYNHLHYKIDFLIHFLFEKANQKERIEVKIGIVKSLFINPWELNITNECQILRYKKEGISDINNISKKGDILLHIYCIA